jgi:dynein heavy chain
VRASLAARGLQAPPQFAGKAIQLFDTLNVRFGVMLVGPTGGGKTACYRALQGALTRLRRELHHPDQRYQVGAGATSWPWPWRLSCMPSCAAVRPASTQHPAPSTPPTRALLQATHALVLNPKSIKIGELYGEYNALSGEWADGLGSALIRVAVADASGDSQWVVWDGPVDALWIENMNTGEW